MTLPLHCVKCLWYCFFGDALVTASKACIVAAWWWQHQQIGSLTMCCGGVGHGPFPSKAVVVLRVQGKSPTRGPSTAVGRVLAVLCMAVACKPVGRHDG